MGARASGRTEVTAATRRETRSTMSALRRWDPLLSRLRPWLGKANTVQAGAIRQWELSPAEEGVAPPALFDPADLERIHGVAPDSGTLAGELQRARGGPVLHFPTTAYELRDATLVAGHLFTREVYCKLADTSAPWRSKAGLREHGDAVLASSHYGVKYFGHWMNDDLPKLLAARELGGPVSTLIHPTQGQRDYIRLLGLETETLTDAQFRRLIVIDDVGQNAYKRRRIATLRSMAEAHAGSAPAPGVMLLRGTSGLRRVLLNEHEVADIARARGFHVIDPAVVDGATLLRLCVGARIVFGVEGSQLTNGVMWMAAAGTAVVIQPPSRFTMVLKAHCDAIGIRYAFIVGDPSGDADFRVDTGALQRLLDRVS
jgi:hypothetical protein